MKQITYNEQYPNGFVEEVEETPVSNEMLIMQLKQKLGATDYQAIKYAEGWMTEEEYAPVREKRQRWRDEINALEQSLEKEVEECSN